MTQTCIWCGATPVTLTHIFRKAWIERLLPGVESFLHTHGRTEDEEFPRSWEKVEPGLAVKAACGACNSGWMDRLDRAAEEIVEPMTLGRDTILRTIKEKETVAAWATMAALLFDHTQQAPTVASINHETFYKTKAPLLGSIVLLSRTATTRLMANGWANTINLTAASGKETRVYFCTFRINNFLAEVFIPERPTQRVGFKIDRRFHREIFPMPLTSVSWPPIGVVPEDKLEAFSRFFETAEFRIAPDFE